MAAVLASPIVLAGPPDDAGSGSDASDTRGNAHKLQGFGSYAGRLDEADVDWFTVEQARSGLTCVRANVTASKGILAQLGVRDAEGSRTLMVVTPPEVTTPLAIATGAYEATDLGLGPAIPPQIASTYTFDLATSAAVPAQLPDPREAGRALDLGACATGDLLALLNGVDAYSVELAAGEVVWYSLASTGPVELRLLAPDGTPVGPAIVADQLAGAIVPATGTYTLSASVVGLPLSRVDYLVAVSAGPDPVTNPCRPNCIATT